MPRINQNFHLSHTLSLTAYCPHPFPQPISVEDQRYIPRDETVSLRPNLPIRLCQKFTALFESQRILGRLMDNGIEDVICVVADRMAYTWMISSL